MSEGPSSDTQKMTNDCSAWRIDPEASEMSMNIHKGINDSHVMITFNLCNGNI